GRLDAVLLVGAVPFPPVVEAFGTTPLRLLPIDRDVAERLRGTGLVSLAVPAAAYTGQAVDVPTLAVAALLVTDTTLTVAEARRVGEAVLGRIGTKEREPLALMVTPGTASLGIPVPLHPAAESLPGVVPR